MTTSDRSVNRAAAARLGRRTVAAGAAIGLLSTTVVIGTGGTAGAAVPPRAQSVGRFLDGAAGGNPIQTLADLDDARATAPGTKRQQNPLGATLLGQAAVPLGHKLQLPGGGVFRLGAVNQVAVARNTGFAFGASGAVRNSGGVSAGGVNGEYPADARIDLSDKSLGSVKIPGVPQLPGAPKLPVGSAPALGGISADIGAISALVKTDVGGRFARPRYRIASFTLNLTSPALAALLQQLANGGEQLQAALKKISTALQKSPTPITSLPPGCQLNLGAIPSTVTLDNGAVVINPSRGSITIDLRKLLEQLGANLDQLPPNTDLLAYVLDNLGRILSHGLAKVVNGIVSPVENLGTNCTEALENEPGIGLLVKTLIKALESGQPKLEQALQNIAGQLSSAGAPGLQTLTSQLSQAIAIGVNVQQGAFPLGDEPAATYSYRTPLAATPDQATGVVIGLGVERALEIDVAGSQGASLALGNASAGPSYIPPAPPTSKAPTNPVPSTAIPTGVPAGEAADSNGASPLPLVLLLVVLGLGGGAAMAYRRRGRLSR